MIDKSNKDREVFQDDEDPTVFYTYGEENLTEIIIRLALKDLRNIQA